MAIRSVSKDFQMKIMRYLEYKHAEETSGFQRGDKLLKTLSNELRNELNSQIFLSRINSMKILQDTFSVEFLKALSFKVQERFYAPNDILFKVLFLLSQTSNCCFY